MWSYVSLLFLCIECVPSRTTSKLWKCVIIYSRSFYLLSLLDNECILRCIICSKMLPTCFKNWSNIAYIALYRLELFSTQFIFIFFVIIRNLRILIRFRYCLQHRYHNTFLHLFCIFKVVCLFSSIFRVSVVASTVVLLNVSIRSFDITCSFLHCFCQGTNKMNNNANCMNLTNSTTRRFACEFYFYTSQFQWLVYAFFCSAHFAPSPPSLFSLSSPLPAPLPLCRLFSLPNTIHMRSLSEASKSFIYVIVLMLFLCVCVLVLLLLF